MAPDAAANLLDQWPAPIVLTHAAGDVFLTLHQEHGFIEATWTGYITVSDVIEAATLSISLFQATHCPGLLSDKSDVVGDWFEANDFLQYEWMPQVTEAGLKYIAYIFPSDMLSLYAFHDLRKRTPPELSLGAFHTREAAKAWLEEKISNNHTKMKSAS